jgi:Ser/Thr protein kinase RdoA (MazF antagonist)
VSPQWTAEIEIDAESARRLITRRFQELADAPLAAIGNGWDNAATALERGLGPDRFGRIEHGRRLPQARERFAEIALAGLIPDPDVFIPEMERIAPTESPARLTIVHGDLYARHVLVDERGALSGVIDWGDIHLGDPAIDLAIAHLVLRPGSSPRTETRSATARCAKRGSGPSP